MNIVRQLDELAYELSYTPTPTSILKMIYMNIDFKKHAVRKVDLDKQIILTFSCLSRSTFIIQLLFWIHNVKLLEQYLHIADTLRFLTFCYTILTPPTFIYPIIVYFTVRACIYQTLPTFSE